nr:MAG TPA: Mediator complex subunit 2 [Caudoviricetes sp.]
MTSCFNDVLKSLALTVVLAILSFTTLLYD